MRQVTGESGREGAAGTVGRLRTLPVGFEDLRFDPSPRCKAQEVSRLVEMAACNDYVRRA